jgi:hypothetical protein
MLGNSKLTDLSLPYETIKTSNLWFEIQAANLFENIAGPPESGG